MWPDVRNIGQERNQPNCASGFSTIFSFSLQTFHTKTTSVDILDIVIRTFLSRRYGLLLRKIQSFDQLFCREISRTFVMECVNMGWQACATPEYVVWSSRLCYIFAFTSRSLNERLFLYGTMCGSLKIWFSDDCCCISYQFLIKVSLRFGTSWWYCVLKDKIRFSFFFVGGGLVSFVDISLLGVCCQ